MPKPSFDIDVDLDGFNEYIARLQVAADSDVGLSQELAHIVAGFTLETLHEETPYRDYELPKGRVPGTLKDGWVQFTGADPKTYGESLPITRVGDGMTITLTNSAFYATMVEYGHKQHPGQWVPPIHNYLKEDHVDPVLFAEKVVVELDENLNRYLAAHFDEAVRRYLG